MGRKMMCFLSILLILFVVSFNSNAQAGTLMFGTKEWYLQWDSAFDKAVAEALVDMLNTDPSTSGYNWSATIKPGFGYLAGPLIGYQTDDNKWSFSAAMMFINTFKSDTEWNASGVEWKSETEMKRNDYDLSVSYMLFDWMKVFAGYKYVKSTYDVKWESDDSDFYNAEMKSNMPTAGIALAASLSDSLILGLQAGAMYIIPKYKLNKQKLKADNSYGLTVEPNITYIFYEHFMLQAGARYQVYRVKFNDPDWGMEGSKNDQMLGLTITAVFLW